VGSGAAMLRELRINNFAIIDEVQLTCAPGMNVLTGETGAGKSIIMRAIGLLCGERAASDLIRTDADDATIEALFELAADQELLEGCGLEAADELLVRRVVSRSGKGRVYVNGGLATASLLSQLGSRLIHIYGQHEQALLLKPESHVEYLDEFGKLGALRARMAAAHGEWREAADRLATLRASGESASQRLELLRFQVGELRDAGIVPGEEQELQQERERQRHAEKLRAICLQSEEALYSGEPAISGTLSRLTNQLQEAARIEASLTESAALLEQAATQVEEVALTLRRAADRIRHDPARLEEIEERLMLLGRLKRKYGCAADALPDHLARLESELAGLEDVGVDLTSAQRVASEREAHAWEVARELSRRRQQATGKLQERMAAELATLGMGGAVFQVCFTVRADDPVGADDAPVRLTPVGGDVVEFHFSANPGEDPKPLARIASGGELSRIMLALKTLTAGAPRATAPAAGAGGGQ